MKALHGLIRLVRSYRVWILALLALLSAYPLIVHMNELRLEPGQSETMWVHSQNGNDYSAVMHVAGGGDGQVRLKYSVDKYAEIGVIDLPGMNTPFPSFLGGTRVRDMRIAAFDHGLTIVDTNKTCHMNGAIGRWSVVSKEDDNEVQLAVFRHDAAGKRFQLVGHTPTRIARKGRNTFVEDTPVPIKKGDVLGLFIKKPIACNRVMLNEIATVFTMSGRMPSVVESIASQDKVAGSYAYSALLEAGKEQGEALGQPNGDVVIGLPKAPVYEHLAWYKFTFSSEGGTLYLKPGLAAMLLDASPFVALTQEATSPWTSKSFSYLLLASLLVLFGLVASLVSSESQDRYRSGIVIAGIIAVFALAKHYSPDFPGLQFIDIVAAYLMVLLLPGIIVSRYYPAYGKEFPSGRIVLGFVLSLVFWFLPAVGLFLVKTSYWPVIVAAFLLVGMAFWKLPHAQKMQAIPVDLSSFWRGLRWLLWGFAVLLAVLALFSSRFQAGSFDTYHHLSMAAKDSALPILGGIHANLYDVSMRSMMPYAYNYWELLIGMVVKVNGFDIGTAYCVGCGLVVLLMFIAQWWLIGLFVKSEKQKIVAFAIVLMIYSLRSLAQFVPVFQRSEFIFAMYGPSVCEFALYAVYIVLGVRAIQSRRMSDFIVFGGLSLATAFFHMEFIFFNCMVSSLLILFSLRENGRFSFNRGHAYLLATILLLVFAGSVVRSHLPEGKIVDANGNPPPMFYALRYDQYNIFLRFYYLLKDFFVYSFSRIWHASGIWGGLLMVIFSRRNASASARLFRHVYFVLLFMLLISFNPIAEMILTPLITSWPLSRVVIYLRAITFTLAAVTLSMGCFYVVRVAMNRFRYTQELMYVLAAMVPFLMLFTADHWLSKIKPVIFTAMYNQGDYLDITYVANLPEFKFIDKYSKGRHVIVLAEKPYNYVIPSLTYAYSYYHDHYPKSLTHIEKRRPIWEACLNAEKNCRSQLPDDSVLLVRNDDVEKFDGLGYHLLFRGRLFSILKV